eukprot:2314497-Amphidinium_carterae.1
MPKAACWKGGKVLRGFLIIGLYSSRLILQRSEIGHPKWTAMHSAYMPSVEKWRSHIGVDLRSSSAALRDVYPIVENAVADVRAAARAIEPHPAIQLSAMLQTVHACLRGNARRT